MIISRCSRRISRYCDEINSFWGRTIAQANLYGVTRIISLYFFYFVAVPKLNVGNLESGYHGLVKENETLVEVTPPIRATGADICSFKIINKHHTDAPFEVCLNLETIPLVYSSLYDIMVLICDNRHRWQFNTIYDYLRTRWIASLIRVPV